MDELSYIVLPVLNTLQEYEAFIDFCIDFFDTGGTSKQVNAMLNLMEETE